MQRTGEKSGVDARRAKSSSVSMTLAASPGPSHTYGSSTARVLRGSVDIIVYCAERLVEQCCTPQLLVSPQKQLPKDLPQQTPSSHALPSARIPLHNRTSRHSRKTSRAGRTTKSRAIQGSGLLERRPDGVAG